MNRCVLICVVKSLTPYAIAGLAFVALRMRVHPNSPTGRVYLPQAFIVLVVCLSGVGFFCKIGYGEVHVVMLGACKVAQFIMEVLDRRWRRGRVEREHEEEFAPLRNGVKEACVGSCSDVHLATVKPRSAPE